MSTSSRGPLPWLLILGACLLIGWVSLNASERRFRVQVDSNINAMETRLKTSRLTPEEIDTISDVLLDFKRQTADHVRHATTGLLLTLAVLGAAFHVLNRKPDA